MNEYCVVLVTCPPNVSEKIARTVLEKRVAVCVNIVSGIRSLFWWENKIDEGTEILLLIKSKKELFRDLENVVKSVHPYEVPEIISLSIDNGNQSYLDWIGKESTGNI